MSFNKILAPQRYTKAKLTGVNSTPVYVYDYNRLVDYVNSLGGGSGSVTSTSIVTANGVSGSVANPTTTPAITITLGAITPTSILASGTIAGSNLSGTNTGDQTTISGNAGSSTAAGITNDVATNATMYPTWVTSISGNLPVKVSSTGIAFNPSTNSFLVGNKGSAPDPIFIGEFVNNQNASTQILVTNTSTSDNALSRIVLNASADFPQNDVTGAHYGQVAFCGKNATFGGNFPFWTNKMIVASGGNGDGLVINADAGPIEFTVRRNTGNFNEDFNTKSIIIVGGSSSVSGNASLTGNVGIRTASPTAKLHLGIGTSTASTAPLKFTTQGTDFLTVAEAGVIEYGTPGFVIQNDSLIIGAKAKVSLETLSIQSAANTSIFSLIKNTSSGTGGISFYRTSNNSSSVCDFGTIGSGYTTNGAFTAGYGYFYSNGTGFNIINDAVASMNFYTGGFAAGNLAVKIQSTGAFLQPSAGTATVAPFALTTSGTTFLSSPTAGTIEYGTPGFVIQNSSLLLGGTALNSNEKISIQGSANSSLLCLLKNTNASTAATAAYQIVNNNVKQLQLGMTSTGYTTDGSFTAGYGYLYTSGVGLNITSGDASGGINFYSGGYASGNLRWNINSTGHFLAQTDNTIDIGASGATRPRTGYFGTSIVTPVILVSGTQTSVNASVSGSIKFSQPQQGATYKVVLVTCAAANGTASYTFPTAFTVTPSVVGTNDAATGLATSVSTTAVTITGATSTGSLMLIGY